MTENKAIRVLEKPSKHIRMVHMTKNEMQFYTFSADLVKAFEKAIDALEEIQSYRAIGTVDEFKAYKLGDCMNDCEHYENCSNYIYSKGYNKAIDDFAKEIEAEYDNDDCPNVADYLDYEISIRKLFEIAEQLKGEKQ